MKRLFEVNGEYFESKQVAKKARGEPTGDGNYKFKVSKGPDHMGNHGATVPATRHRAPQGYHEPKPKTALAA